MFHFFFGFAESSKYMIFPVYYCILIILVQGQDMPYVNPDQGGQPIYRTYLKINTSVMFMFICQWVTSLAKEVMFSLALPIGLFVCKQRYSKVMNR